VRLRDGAHKLRDAASAAEMVAEVGVDGDLHGSREVGPQESAGLVESQDQPQSVRTRPARKQQWHPPVPPVAEQHEVQHADDARQLHSWLARERVFGRSSLQGGGGAVANRRHSA
jgi:hypothetical protein